MKRLPLIHILFFIVPLNLIFGQCLIENLNAPTAMSSGFGVGQQFIACQTGLLEEIEFKTVGWVTSPITLNLKDASCNTIWTVSGITAGSNQIINVDLSGGSGSTRNLTSGQTYQFHIPVNGSNIFSVSVSNPYPDGEAINNSICSVSSNVDLWFRIGIGQSLPVELINFHGKARKNQIDLTWSTASETNNAHFEIQKSKNGNDWRTLTFVKGQGTSYEVNDYQYQDVNPFSGINYYRLKQIDYDGAFEYSQIISVDFITSIKSIQIYPNPSNGLVNLNIENPLNQPIRVWVTDNLGREIWEQEVGKEESNWQTKIEIERAGVYFLISKIGNVQFFERIVNNLSYE